MKTRNQKGIESFTGDEERGNDCSKRSESIYEVVYNIKLERGYNYV